MLGNVMRRIVTTLQKNSFAFPLKHFAHNLRSLAHPLRYASVVGYVLGQADRCIGEFRGRLQKAVLALPSNRGERDRDMDSNPLRV